jgi:hypothetical protein
MHRRAPHRVSAGNTWGFRDRQARIDPADPIDRMDPADPIDRIDPLDPMLRIDPAEPRDTLLVSITPSSQAARRSLSWRTPHRQRHRGGQCRTGWCRKSATGRRHTRPHYPERAVALTQPATGDNRPVTTIERPLPPLNADERTTLES